MKLKFTSLIMLCVILLFGCRTADVDIKNYDMLTTKSVTEMSVSDVIYNAVFNQNDTCDISDYNIFIDEFVDKYNVWKLIAENPIINYVAQFYYHTIDDVVTEIGFEYYYTPDDYHERLNNSVDFAVAEILEQLSHNYEPAELVCAINDYIATHCEYAYESDGVTPNTTLGYNAYSALVLGQAICEGYADAFTLLSQRFGLDVKKISGTIIPDNVGHAWNLVKIDDFWYHVDTTWNDPTPDKPGSARHDYLLISDQAIGNYRNGSQEYHADWDGDAPKAVDSRYDNAFWIYEDMPISFAEKHFADYETKIAQTLFADVITYTYNTDTEANVARFGYDLAQLTAEIEQLYPYIGYRYTINSDGIITKVGDWVK